MKKMMSRFHVNGRLCLGICGFGALFCLSPLIFLIFGRTREANDASLQSFHNLSSDSANSYTAFFFVTIISTADVLLDLPPKLAAYFRATEKEETSQTATKISRLSEIERSIFIVGVLLQSAVGFLPTSTDVIIVEFVQNCTKNASLLLIFAPISVYLQRCTTTFTVSRIFAMALISTAGYILQTLSYFVEKRSYSWSLLILLSGVSMYAVSILFTMFALLSAIKYCIEKIKARKSPGNLSVRTGTTDDSDDELYTNYIPGLHMLSTLILGSAETSVALTPLDKIEDSIRNRNYVVLFVVVMVLVIELRVRKNEIARELIALLDSKKSYVRYISHELRTPLSAAFLGLKLLTTDLKASRNPVDMARYDTLYDINMSCVAAVDILNDLLCYDKLGSGALELHEEEIVVESYVQSSLSMFTAQANESGATLQLLPLPDNHTITENGAYTALGLNRIHLPVHGTDVIIADKFKIDQVLRNVISNALKFTPRGGRVTMSASFMPDIIMKTPAPITRYKSISGLKTRDVTDTSLSVATKETRRPKPKPYKWLRSSSAVHCETDLENTKNTKNTINGMLVIVITDTGAGISIANQGRLFKEVVQFSPEKLQAGGGSGLGLWITSGILDMHNGKISVYSEGEGCGSSFTIQLPMTRQGVLSSPLPPSLSSSLVLKGICCHNDNIHINNNNNNNSRSNNTNDNDNNNYNNNNNNSNNDKSNNNNDGIGNDRNIDNANNNNNTINNNNNNINNINNNIKNYNDENDIESNGSSADGTESELNDNYNIYTDSPRCVYCPSPLLNTSDTQDTYQLPSLDLLIIDDSPVNCKMLMKCLKAVGHSCVSGSDGIMAIAMVKDRIDYVNGGKGRPFDAILMDFMMPNMDGPSATKIIRSMGYTAPILGLTGNGLPADVSYFMGCGVDKVLLKPLDLDLFLHTMTVYQNESKNEQIKEMGNEIERERGRYIGRA